MKYSEQLVWQAVYEFVPAFKVAKENGINFDLPEALKTAALECFVEIGNNSIACLGTSRSYAAYIVQDALKECKATGYLTFGGQENYWG